MGVVDCDTGYENFLLFGFSPSTVFKVREFVFGDGALNSSQRITRTSATPEQDMWAGFIWRSIDDALMPPLGKRDTYKYKQDLRFKGTRGKDKNRYRDAKSKLHEEETRQTAVHFIMDTTFLGMYKYAFQTNGEWIQGQLIETIRKVEKTPSSSGYWRGIFKDGANERPD
jgi:hypothetical protein